MEGAEDSTMGSLAGGFRFDFDDDDDNLGWSGIADDGSEEEGADFFPMVGKGVGSDCRWARVGVRGVVFEPGLTSLSPPVPPSSAIGKQAAAITSSSSSPNTSSGG